MKDGIVKRNGELKRPSWNYIQPKGDHPATTRTDLLEMTESVRNVLEGIQESQMLQCDVAGAIKDIAKTLRRIDRRMARKAATR